jgi:hypothetical protein
MTGHKRMTENTSAFRRHVDRRSFIGCSAPRTIVETVETAVMHPCSEKRGPVEPEPLSGNRAREGTNTRPSTCSVRAAHAEFVAILETRPPRTIPLDVEAADLEDRARHLNNVFDALSIYVTAILDDTTQNTPGRLDFGGVGAALFDLASDVTGTIQLAADAMAAGRVA